MNTDKYTEILAAAKEKNAQLIVVSKTKPIETVMQFYELGQRAFGENKVQELVEKHGQMPKDIQWHLIGHLQTNKVRHIASFVYTIHAVDTAKLIEEINKQAKKAGRIINCLLQVHIAEEETKYGWSKKGLISFLNETKLSNFKHIRILGLMAMATNTTNESQIASEFGQLQNFFQNLKKEFFSEATDFNQLSIGMSSDYLIALENGSTMIRVGSVLYS